MPDSDDLLIFGGLAAAVFFGSWMLGNRLERLPDAILGGLGSGLSSGAAKAGKAASEFSKGVKSPIRQETPPVSPAVKTFFPAAGAEFVLERRGDTYNITQGFFRPTGGASRVATSAPIPVVAPPVVYSTEPDDQGEYFYPKQTAAYQAGAGFRQPGTFQRALIPGSTLFDNVKGWFS